MSELNPESSSVKYKKIATDLEVPKLNLFIWLKSIITKSAKYIWLGSVAVLVTFSLYFYIELSSIKSNPNKILAEENRKIISQVGKLIVLPKGETPTIATLTDMERLKEQLFFANAKKGDKILIYTSSKKAILYNPESNKIIEVAPVNIGNFNK